MSNHTTSAQRANARYDRIWEKAKALKAIQDNRIGQRVEIGPHHDLWMQGARYGAIQRVTKNRAGREVLVLKMDHPQVKRPVKVFADEVTYL